MTESFASKYKLVEISSFVNVLRSVSDQSTIL